MALFRSFSRSLLTALPRLPAASGTAQPRVGGLLKQTSALEQLATPPLLCRGLFKHDYSPEKHLQLYRQEDGKRQAMTCGIKRFKRLDWGVYIRPRAGRVKKHWKKDPAHLWKGEQHVFLPAYQVRRMERMFDPQYKRPRHFPDDPYLKYNRMSFHKHRWVKLKNNERVRQYGDNVYRFNRWKAHLSSKASRFNRPPFDHYEPPGYHEDVAEDEVYRPAEFVPRDTPAPHFQRPHIRRKKGMPDLRAFKIKELEPYSGFLDVWHPALKSMYHKY